MDSIQSHTKYVKLELNTLETHIYIATLDYYHNKITQQLAADTCILTPPNSKQIITSDEHIQNIKNEYRKTLIKQINQDMEQHLTLAIPRV